MHKKSIKDVNIKDLKFYGCPIPYGNYLKKPYYKNIFLVGDAAGFVDPLMGEGIAYAMQSGAFAASVINKAIDVGRYDEETLSEYQALCKKEFSANFALATRVGVRGPSLAEIILPKVNGHKLAAKVMTMVARGEIGYSDIPYVVLKKLPREIPTIIKHMVRSRLATAS